MKPLTPEQHQIMEDLTGRQLRRDGTPRKIPRKRSETLRLGLRDPIAEQQRIRIDAYRDLLKQMPEDLAKQALIEKFPDMTRLKIMLLNLQYEET